MLPLLTKHRPCARTAYVSRGWSVGSKLASSFEGRPHPQGPLCPPSAPGLTRDLPVMSLGNAIWGRKGGALPSTKRMCWWDAYLAQGADHTALISGRGSKPHIGQRDYLKINKLLEGSPGDRSTLLNMLSKGMQTALCRDRLLKPPRGCVWTLSRM